MNPQFGISQVKAADILAYYLYVSWILQIIANVLSSITHLLQEQQDRLHWYLFEPIYRPQIVF